MFVGDARLALAILAVVGAAVAMIACGAATLAPADCCSPGASSS